MSASAPIPTNASTGPRTAEGKAVSSQNARKHGLTSAAPFIPEEQREAYSALEAALRNELEPAGTSQELTFRHILANSWNLLRIEKMEAEAQDLDQLMKLQRYRTAAERGCQRARNELSDQQSHARRLALTKRTPAADLNNSLEILNNVRERYSRLQRMLHSDPFAEDDDAEQAATRRGAEGTSNPIRS